MSSRDRLVVIIALIALFSIPVILFSAPVGMDSKTYGAVAFGLILLFGALNIILAWRETIRNRKNRK